MIKASVGPRLDELVRRLFPFLFRRPLNPHVLTVCGVVVSLVAASAFVAGWFLVGGLLVLAGGFFDLVDGVVARHRGVTTRFGAFLDSTLDRLVDMTLLLGIAVFYATAGEPWNVLLAGYVLVASVLVSYSKARAELVVRSFDVGILERGERIGILALGTITGFVIPALWILAIGSSITVIQRFALAYREMERMDEAERSGLGEQTG